MRSGAIHVSPDAFGNNWWGSPPSTDTSQVSHKKRAFSCVYATLDPSGENVTDRAVLAGVWHAPGGFDVSVLSQAESARPYTITTSDGTDRVSVNGKRTSLDEFRG